MTPPGTSAKLVGNLVTLRTEIGQQQWERRAPLSLIIDIQGPGSFFRHEPLTPGRVKLDGYEFVQAVAPDAPLRVAQYIARAVLRAADHGS